jgi:hypothetical protein
MEELSQLQALAAFTRAKYSLLHDWITGRKFGPKVRSYCLCCVAVGRCSEVTIGRVKFGSVTEGFRSAFARLRSRTGSPQHHGAAAGEDSSLPQTRASQVCGVTKQQSVRHGL